MKKLLLFLLLCLGLTVSSFADYLDNWPDEALCGWMDNPSPPSYMVEEVKTRGISCAWGVVINNLPDSLDVVNNDSLDISIGAGLAAVVPGYVNKEFTLETWLSEFEVKPEDLGPMIVELRLKEKTPTPSWLFDNSQPEYAPSDEIINKKQLVADLFTYHRDFNNLLSYGPYQGHPVGRYGFKDDRLSLRFKGDHQYTTLYPDEILANYEIRVEDIPAMLEPFEYQISKDRGYIPQLKFGFSDEIVNTDQLIRSLLFLDPNFLDPNLTHNWEGPDKIIVKEYVENTYEIHPWTHPECFVPVEERGEEFKERCMVFQVLLTDPPIVQPPLEPIPPVPIRPGWKIAEGSNFWTMDETDPYWQTEEGIKKVEAAKKRGSWIEQEASRYAQENPGVDAPIPSYYATDSCGEGKQPDNASC